MACNCGGSQRVRERRQAQIAAREARKVAREAARQESNKTVAAKS